MVRLDLLGGFYQAKSIISNAQRRINLYPEINPKDAPTPVTHYQRPGLTPVAQGERAPVRGLWRASNGQGYAVIGQQLYYIDPGFGLEPLGVLGFGEVSTPVTFVDNGIDLLVCDGSASGLDVTLASNATAAISDPTGAFQGATRLAVLDGFIFGSIPGSQSFFSTLDNEITFDPLYVQDKNGYPDLLMGVAVSRREIFLIGSLTTEIWFDSGGSGYPFAELPGAFIQHGTVSTYSIAQEDTSIFMLGQDPQGVGVVFRVSGYDCKRISTHALEQIIQRYPRLDDAIGYTYQQDGHVFYVLTFPTADATWVFDDSGGLWHQRTWTDGNGILRRVRDNCHAFIYGKNLVGDWENGTIYELDRGAWADLVDGVVCPLTCICSFPHIQTATLPNGQPVQTTGRRMGFDLFQADMECGTGWPADGTPPTNLPPQVGLRWSDDRGRTWGQTVWQTAGFQGEYLSSPTWRNLGAGITRDRVFELEYSFAAPAALNGAWVDANVLES